MQRKITAILCRLTKFGPLIPCLVGVHGGMRMLGEGLVNACA